LQFPHISRPGIRHKGVHRGLGYIKNAFAHASSKDLDKVCDQQWNIVAAFPQSWEGNGKNVETIIKIAAEFVESDHFR